MSNLTLISFDLCPFVQRALIALHEKGVEHDIRYIDLFNKPDWFLELSPLGKVPVLQVGDEVLFESAVIAEYIDETTGTPEQRLHPTDPLERAKQRAWIEFTSTMYADSYAMTMAEDRARVEELFATIRGKLERLEAQLGDGPFFEGARFSLVDASAAPLLQRLTWTDRAAPELNHFEGLPKLTAWRDTLLARPSVQRSTVEDIEDRYGVYLRGAGERGSWLGKMAA